MDRNIEIKVKDDKVDFTVETDNFLEDITIISCLVLDKIAKDKNLNRSVLFNGFIENVQNYMERKNIK